MVLIQKVIVALIVAFWCGYGIRLLQEKFDQAERHILFVFAIILSIAGAICVLAV